MILVPSLADIAKTATSNAEKFVAGLLAGIATRQDAVAFWSLKLRSHPYKQQAEADFVVLWNGVVILLEVKGGGVKKSDGSWYSIDRYGDWHSLASSPMEQARSAMYALREILTEEGVGWYAHEAAVVTPDIDAPPDAVEWKPTHWLTKDDMSAERLRQALDAIVMKTSLPPPRVKLASPDVLRARLFGEFTRMPAIDVLRGAILEEQNRATEGQARVLSSLAKNPRLMVVGGAGTGKSLVLVEGAKQEAGLGRSTLITFYSPELMRFFQPRLEGQVIDVIPFGDLTSDKMYDVVFVDEAQDLMTADQMDRIDSVVSGGRTGGRWRMFLDPNNQAQVDGRFDQDIYDLVSEETTLIDLNLNIRNTRAVVHMVQSYLGADIGDPGIVNGEPVQWQFCNNRTPLEEACLVAVDLIDGGVGKDKIWIIRANSESTPFRSPEGVIVTSPRFAKGLEADHVIMCDLPAKFDDAGTAAFYVAVTRPRVALHLVVSADDKRRLQQLAREQLAGSRNKEAVI